MSYKEELARCVECGIELLVCFDPDFPECCDDCFLEFLRNQRDKKESEE